MVLHFGRRCFVFGHPCSAQTGQPHQVVWSRIGDTLVIVNDRRLKCELLRSCCQQECGDVDIPTPNTLRCMRCHSTALFVWFDVRISRLCNFLMFFSLSIFLTRCSHLLLDMSLTALVSDSFGTSEDQVEVLAGQSNLRSCWRLPCMYMVCHVILPISNQNNTDMCFTTQLRGACGPTQWCECWRASFNRWVWITVRSLLKFHVIF